MGVLGLKPDFARQDIPAGISLDKRLEMQWAQREELRKSTAGNNGDDGNGNDILSPGGNRPDFQKLANEMQAGTRDSGGYVDEVDTMEAEANTEKYNKQVDDAQLATQRMREVTSTQQKNLAAAAPGPDQNFTAPPVDIRLGSDDPEEEDLEDETLGRRRKPREAFGSAAGIKI